MFTLLWFLGRTTSDFRTDDASGSTSQAANIVEALELQSELLLIDEDTTATNFMIRDARMQASLRPHPAGSKRSDKSIDQNAKQTSHVGEPVQNVVDSEAQGQSLTAKVAKMPLVP